MSWSVLQSVSNFNDVGATVAATFTTANVSSGSKIIAIVSCGDNGTGITVSSVKNGAGNSWTQLGVKAYPNADGNVYLFALDAPAGDVGTKPTITATFSSLSGGGVAILIQEVSGLLAGNTSAMLDGSPGTANGNSGTSTTSPTYSSSTANEYLVAVYGDYEDVTTTWTDPSGYTGATAGPGSAGAATGRNASNSSNLELAYKNSSGGSETASFGISPASNYAVLLVAFQLAAVATPDMSPSPFGIIPPGRQSPMAFQFIPQALPSYQSSSVQNSLTLTAQIAGSGSVRSLTARILAALAVVTSTVSRALGKLVTGVITATGAVTRNTSRSLSSVLTATASVPRGIARQLAGQLAVFASVAMVKAKLVSLAAQAVMTGALSTRTGRTLTATCTATVTTVRALARALAATVIMTAATSLIKVKLISLAAIAAVTGSLRRSPGMTMSGTAVTAGSLGASTRKILAAAAVLGASAQRSFGKIMTAVVTLTGSISQIKVKLVALSAMAAIFPGTARGISKGIPGQFQVTAAVTRKITQTLAAAVTATASSFRTRMVILIAAARAAGSVAATTVKPVTTIIFKLGVPAFRWITGTVTRNWKTP